MFMQRLAALTAIAGLSFFSASSIAAPIAVPNGDFEGLGDTNNLDNWAPGALGTGSAQPGGGGGAAIGDAPNFQQNLQSFSNSDANGDNGDASLEQILSTTFTENFEYTLTGDAGARSFAFQDFTAEATVTLELFDSVTGEIVASGSIGPIANTPANIYSGTLTGFSAVGTAEADNAGNAIGIRIKSEIVNLPSGPGQVELRIDNIALDGVLIPEPGSLALLGLGGLLVARRRRG